MAATKRELFKAAEVCEVVQVQPYVLRSWEVEFPQIGQAPPGGGARLYRRSDVEFVLRIKQLILEEGLTLSGARRRLEEDNGENNGAAILVEEVVGDRVRQQLRQVKTGLRSILELLSKDAEEPPELHLVAPAAPKKKVAAKAKSKK
ncbi:MAG TPA: MerR family transcriptional regulator [Vicinamibacterales bacterium]|nr:MerR family transcriptional regulator [Vicinamibacterales bacterium]